MVANTVLYSARSIKEVEREGGGEFEGGCTINRPRAN